MNADRRDWVVRKMGVNTALFLLMYLISQLALLLPNEALSVTINQIATLVMLLAALAAYSYPFVGMALDEWDGVSEPSGAPRGE